MKRFFYAALTGALFFLTLAFGSYASAGRWPGVDETVVQKYAGEHGRPVRQCLFNLDGDALLFAFLLAGVGGGFVIGYYYRGYFSKKPEGGKPDAR